MDQGSRQQLWRDLDAGWIMTVELLTATFVWGGIGWLIDRWLETAPWVMVAGFTLGFGLGMYLLFLRAAAQGRAADAERERL